MEEGRRGMKKSSDGFGETEIRGKRKKKEGNRIEWK
jgi:hypothetical protein